MNTQKTYNWLSYILFAGFGGLVACSPTGEQAVEKEQSTLTSSVTSVTISEAQFRETGIVLGSPDTLMLGETIQATGKLEAPPDHWASVHAPLGGFVRSTRLIEGDYVRKGQVLAVLEHPDYIKLQQEYLQALAQSKFERQELDRQTELNREEVGARRKLQQSTADFETTKALLTSLEAQLTALHIPLEKLQKGSISQSIPLLAPINGYVDKVNLRLGQYVGPSVELVEIVNKEHLYLELRVFENDIRKVKEGQLIRFVIPQQQTGEMQAKVHRVGQAFDPQSRTVLVHANLVGQDFGSLFAESYVRATILADQKTVVALPEEAVVKEGNVSYVYVRQTGGPTGSYQFKLVPVTTGVTQNGSVEVKLPGDLTSGEIVRQGAYFISAERAKQAG